MRFSELDGAAVGVWGAGREIRSFAAQLSTRLPAARIAVAAFDETPAADVAARLHTRIAVGADVEAALAACDVVVRSPGVSIHRPELVRLRSRGIPVTTATALWLAERGGERVLGVTGTKGKSTTAALAFTLLRAAGADAELAGNIGVPALDLLDRPAALAVVELSSYQIADLEVGPEVALVTNLYREHADWHGSDEAYRREKLRLLELPGVRRAVLGARSPALASLAVPVPVTRFGAAPGWDVAAGAVVRGGREIVALAELPLLGEHNALNLCAALAGIEALGASAPPLPQALGSFRGLAHRLQTVAEEDGVTWVDDSISTTPESTLAALASFPGRGIVLIAGGQDRGQDHAELAIELVTREVRLVAVPSTGPRLLEAALAAGLAADHARLAPDMATAVAAARDLAVAGDVVLLSPAAPSYDNYRDFEERGERFRALAASS